MRNHEKMINSFIGNRTNHSEISRILIEKRVKKTHTQQVRQYDFKSFKEPIKEKLFLIDKEFAGIY